jgi:hypothetical protein
LKLQGRAIWFPYNLLEDEPSGPFTELRLERIAQTADYAEAHGLRSIQGNAQTPLVQLPNLAALGLAAWDGDVMDASHGALAQLAERLVGDDADVLADAWRALDSRDVDECRRLAEEIRWLAHNRTAAGTLSVILGEWQPQVLEDLATMLTIHAQAVTFAQQVDRHVPPEGLVDALTVYLVVTANWLGQTGYHDKRIVMQRPYFDPVFYGLCRVRGDLGRDGLEHHLVAPAIEMASRHSAAEYVEYVAQTVTGQRR